MLAEGPPQVAGEEVVEGELPAQHAEHQLALGGNGAAEQAGSVRTVRLDARQCGRRLQTGVSGNALRAQPALR